MSNIKHIPTPWVFPKEISDPNFALTTDGSQVPFSANDPSTAAFIVRAVNTHDDLIAALKMARECIAYCRRAHEDAQSGEGFPVEMVIDATLAKAEGKEG